ncbi:MAG TPA: UDP-N-acetylmuramoyl-L-alanyl-D-glutamate--2,6-diaminopimelate ligase [Propionibacteriaceae bacterium]|nr:UDP-N-acetylmuramoyl-L-alanyl-D-glutamate--2,6-diaminopimelate ligase [Propionibacteriaceae bacterium]
MRLTDLFPQAGPALVSGITHDSRLVRPGDLYVALPGRRHHGAEFAAQATADGAPAVLTDAAGARLVGPLEVPLVVVADPRREMAGAAAAIFGRPAEDMTMYAVTGTNGKTTTTFLLDAALRAAGFHTGMVGTIGFFLDGRPLEATRTTVTTPESTELQALLGYLREQGTQAVAMEVSSHALALGRVDAIPFAVAAFTNLGRDHLDFHGDEEAYFAAKASLFTPDRSRHAVVNIDDPRGRLLADRLAAAGRPELTTISLTGPADCEALTCDLRDDGRTGVRARLRDRTVEFTLSLPGEFNVRNAVTALAMVAASGGDLDAAARGLADASVPGRMQRVDLGPQGPVVYVDFAHTPQAVAAALQAVGPQRRRIAVLGCGGDRDPEKRRPMGAAAANHADLVLVTDDNPRSEDPAAIRAEVLAGARAAMSAGGRASEVLDAGDRRSAIRQALSRARPGEVIAILGKGHELGQEVAGEVFPFSDAEVAAAEWAARAE